MVQTVLSVSMCRFCTAIWVGCKQNSLWVVSSRAFTVYQLIDTIIQELPNAIKQHNVKIVIVTNLLHYFTDDLYLDIDEMKKILKEIVKSLNKIQNCLLVVSL